VLINSGILAAAENHNAAITDFSAGQGIPKLALAI
jgi:hypothetical protein